MLLQKAYVCQHKNQYYDTKIYFEVRSITNKIRLWGKYLHSSPVHKLDFIVNVAAYTNNDHIHLKFPVD